MRRDKESADAEERFAEKRDVEEVPGAGREELYGDKPMSGTYGGAGTETETPMAGTREEPGSLPGEDRLDVPEKCPVCGGETEHVPTCKGCGDPVTRCKCR